jgi:chromosome segregation ATPase
MFGMGSIPVPMAGMAMAGSTVQASPAGAAVTTVTSGGPQLVLQSNAVDVETDGGFVISLPSPPPVSPYLPEFAEDHSPNSAVNRAIAHQRHKIELVSAKIAIKKQALADHETWLEQATRAIERVKKQIRETKLSKKAIKHNLDNLEETRRSEVKLTQRTKLAKELEETRAKLTVLSEQHAAVVRAKEAIQRQRNRVSQSALKYGKLLNWHHDQLQSKIQEFEDQNNDLAHIGQTPTHSIEHIDGVLQDDEEVRMAEI